VGYNAYMKARIHLDREKIADFCVRNHVQKLSLFGSVLREDFNSESDVDMLIEFEPGFRIGLLGLAGLEIELSQIVGRKVDLRTPQELSDYFRDQVLATAEVQYAA
jgi:uncharacterized protein